MTTNNSTAAMSFYCPLAKPALTARGREESAGMTIVSADGVNTTEAAEDVVALLEKGADWALGLLPETQPQRAEVWGHTSPSTALTHTHGRRLSTCTPGALRGTPRAPASP